MSAESKSSSYACFHGTHTFRLDVKQTPDETSKEDIEKFLVPIYFGTLISTFNCLNRQNEAGIRGCPEECEIKVLSRELSQALKNNQK